MKYYETTYEDYINAKENFNLHKYANKEFQVDWGQAAGFAPQRCFECSSICPVTVMHFACWVSRAAFLRPRQMMGLCLWLVAIPCSPCRLLITGPSSAPKAALFVSFSLYSILLICSAFATCCGYTSASFSHGQINNNHYIRMGQL